MPVENCEMVKHKWCAQDGKCKQILVTYALFDDGLSSESAVNGGNGSVKNIIKIKIFGEDADNCLVQKVL